MTDRPGANSGVGDVPGLDEDEMRRQAKVDARRYIDELLRLRGISRVVNVDDGNRQDDDQEVDLPLVAHTIGSGILSIERLLESETTRAVVIDSDGEPLGVDDILDRVRVDPPAFSTTVAKELTDAARLADRAHRQSEAPTDGAADADVGPVPDDTAMSADLETLADLGSLFPEKADFKALTLAQWQKEKDSILADATPLLLLFDRDFRLENARADAGERLIAEILGAEYSHVYCGMLTHSATSDQAEREAIANITENYDLDPLRLIVMAKNQVTHAPIELARKLKAALLAEELLALRDMVTSALTESAAEGCAELTQLDPFTVQALVDAAGDEGAHEAHNLVRIAASRSRRSLDRLLRDEVVTTGPLPNIRAANAAGPTENVFPPPADLARRKHVDHFDDAEHLASLNLPVEPGDIFETVSPNSLLTGMEASPGSRFLLLTQACDAMIRPNGIRMANPTMLVVAPMKWIPDPKQGERSRVRRSDFVLRWFEEDRTGGEWYVRLAERTQVPSLALDACALSRDGSGVIIAGEGPPASATRGWANVHGKLQKWAQSKISQMEMLGTKAELKGALRKMIIESLTGASSQLHNIKAEIDPNRKIVAFGVRRIARLTDANTRSLLTLASHHIGRPADDGPLFPD